MKPSLLVDAQARLGECALWCDRTASLWWTDIEARSISRRSADGSIQHWPLPEKVGSFAFCEADGRLLVGLASGIALFDPADGSVSGLTAMDWGVAGARINDGRCDRQGRFVFGLYHAAETPVCHFYRVGPGLQVERLPLPPAGVANSIAFSPDGATMYYTDSPLRTIFSLAYGADGSLGEPRPFVKLSSTEGFADGSAVDADGGLWNAQWDGSCLVRYAADGQETQRITLPVSRPTCPAFGGPDLGDLYLTTARIGLDAGALERQPQAGGVFAMQPGRRGLPEERFRTA
ncbi:SMP-30/gluconolactonase/LRE family protein [uncultured Ramlibacter sp.]|uniref:SMP-30/gluconolactonase/LRE family protein n=1 Tax=uncultured Ramlibacter sp. TaxID=260755 RepID=UPI00261DCF20|nr:SMP-30/gluconolactonase/LRE family protein [uncultured Ramlibacter sp.]